MDFRTGEVEQWAALLTRWPQFDEPDVDADE